MAASRELHDILPSLRRILRRFRPNVRKHRALAAGSVLLLLVEIALRLLEPWPLKFIFDRVIPAAPSGGRSGIAWIDALEPMTLLSLAAAAVVGITALRALAAYGNTVGFALMGNRVLTDVRSELYRRLQALSLSFHAKARSGDLVVRVIGDMGLLKDVTVTAVLPLLANLVLLICMMGVMLGLHWQLALVAFAVFPWFWISAARLGGRIREVSRKQRRREGAMAATAAESMGSIKIIQALSLEGVFEESFSGQNRGSMKDDVKGRRLAARLERRVDVLIAVSAALVLLYGARLVMENVLTPGDLLVFLAYLKDAFKPVRNFAKFTGRLAKASAACDRVVDILDEEPEVRDLPDAVPAPPFAGNVRFEKVSFAYEKGRNALEEIDFEAKEGERIALVGPSGAGKSTLASLILRLYDPGSGRISIDGIDIRRYTLSSLRSRIGMVLAEPMLFMASVRENIAFGAPDATAEEVEAAARLANAHEFIESLPEGYDTVVGERGVTLSTGQCQRIAIARAAVRGGRILLLDEPTKGLDRENGLAVAESLERLARGRTTFVITHDLDLASGADRILYLEGGRIREQGTHAELLRAGGRYAEFRRYESASRDGTGKEEPRAVSR
ncbi:MAG: ABC transporter ATP-binding protein [Deltaproteobacteria bacterium]